MWISTGIIYSAIGHPQSMFTVMFAIARAVGGFAHWQEMISDPTMKISRPRQLYTGSTKRDYIEISDRGAAPVLLNRFWLASREQGFELNHVRSSHRPPVHGA